MQLRVEGRGPSRAEAAVEPDAERPRWDRRDVAALVALLLLCALTHVFGLGRRPLWDIDEGMHAATSRVMVESGDWIVPLMNGQPFLDKPILYNWLASLSFLALGFTELAARLPAALLGTGVVLLTWLLGRRAFGRLAGWLAGAALATSFLHVALSRVVVHDIALCFCVTAALTAFHAAYRAQGRRPLVALGFWTALGASVLAKGPVGPVLIGMPIALVLLRDRRWRFVRELQPLRGALLALAIALPWYVALSLRVPGYARYFFLERNVQGFLSGKGGHSEPWLYYVPVLLVGAIPWTGFALLGFGRALREQAGARKPELFWILVCFASCFLFFSAARAKLATYVLPCLPPMALAVGWVWSETMRTPDPRQRRAFLIAAAPLPVAFGVAAGLLWLLPWDRLREDLGLDPRGLAQLATAIFALSAAAWLLARKERYRLAFAAQLSISVGLLVAFVVSIAPRMDEYRSTRTLALALDRELPAGQPLAIWRGLRDSALFYTGRDEVELIKLPGGVDSYVHAPEPVFFLLRRKDVEPLGREHPELYEVAWLGKTLVISNRPQALRLPDGSTQPVLTLGEIARDEPAAFARLRRTTSRPTKAPVLRAARDPRRTR